MFSSAVAVVDDVLLVNSLSINEEPFLRNLSSGDYKRSWGRAWKYSTNRNNMEKNP